MNTPDGIDLALLNSRPDKVNREHWAKAAGVVMARSWTPVMLHIVVSQGFDIFKKRARAVMGGHAFSEDDYRTMFGIIKRTAAMNPINGPVNIENISQ